MQLEDILALAAAEGARRHIEKRAGLMLPLAIGTQLPGIARRAIDRTKSTEEQLENAAERPFKTAAAGPDFLGKLRDLSSMLGHGATAAKKTAIPYGNALLGTSGVQKGPGGPNSANSKPTGFYGSISQLGASPLEGVAGGISGGIGDLLKKKIVGQEFGEKKDPFHMGAGEAVKSFGKEMGTAGAGLLMDMMAKAQDTAAHAGDDAARVAILGELKRTDPVLADADNKTLMDAFHTMSRFAPVLSTDKNAVRSFLRQAVMSGSGPDFMSIKLIADAERAVNGEKKAALPSALEELLPSLVRGGLLGAGTGAVSGAIADKDDRGGGALRGALTGGALGGLGGALHGHMAGVPRDQGGLPPAVEMDVTQGQSRHQGRSPNIMGVPRDNRETMWHPRANPKPGYPHQGLRDLPIGVAEAAQELGHDPFTGPPVRS